MVSLQNSCVANGAGTLKLGRCIAAGTVRITNLKCQSHDFFVAVPCGGDSCEQFNHSCMV